MSDNITAIETQDRSMLTVGRAIVRKLGPAEDAIDAAIADSSALLAAVATGRVRSGMAAEVGQDAIQSVFRSLSALVTARGEMIDGHRVLSRVQNAFGMEDLDFGCSATKFAAARRIKASAQAA